MDVTHAVRSVFRGLPHMVLGGVPKERAGAGRLAYRRLGLQPGRISLSSDGFSEGAPIPLEYSAEGGNERPALHWSGLPEGTRSAVLLVEDPDAPTPNPFVHWIVYDIPLGAHSSEVALSTGARQGRNSMFTTGWTGCAPPRGDQAHRYVFQLFALDRPLNLRPNAGRITLLEAMRGHVLGCTTLTGTYQRS